MDPVNQEYYERESPGRLDYWIKMADARFGVEQFLTLLDGEPVKILVDLGCGNGQLLGDVAARRPGLALCGLDSSEAQIAANREEGPAIDWRTFDLDQAVSFPAELKGRFDAVLASEIIEHLSHPDVFLRNAFELARPGTGILILSTQSGRIWETERRVGHLRHFTAADLSGLLAAGGWRPVKVWNAGYPFHDWSKWLANRDPDAAMARFGGDAYGPWQNLVCWALRLAFRLNSARSGAQLFAVARRP
jgi:2-polyprenyl-3-methyl-5-hydroxy-6-metoxy-1,4-benzoquinol methylase